MVHPLPIRRAGMTLVELLVVITILGLLAVTVLPSLATSAESRRTRETTRTVSSFIAKAQGRAIGRQEWSGLKLMAVNASSAAAIDLFLADVPDAYRGDTTSAALTISASTATTRTGTSDAISSITGTGIFNLGIRAGDPIRFDGRGPAYKVTGTSATSITFALRGNDVNDPYNDDVGQTAHNTPWPASGVSHTFEIYRSPQTSGMPLTLPGGRAIDLYWSGFGPPQANQMPGTYRPFVHVKNSFYPAPLAQGVSDISVVFDATGRLRQVFAGNDRYSTTGPVFLLVGRADRANQAYLEYSTFTANKGADDSIGANWQYPDSYWVAIDPATGLVRTAECSPEDLSWAGLNEYQKLIRSQDWIRQALLAGGT